VDIVYTSGAYYTNVLSEIDALKLSDYTPWEERTSGATAYLNDLHQKKLGVYYLGRLGLDAKFFVYLKKPVKSADFTGMNIRVSPLYLQAIKGLGGNPVVMPLGDTYLALERNVVDGACSPGVGLREWGWQKQLKYVVEPGFYRIPNPFLVNLNAWNKLPQKLKDILRDSILEGERKVVAEMEDLAKKERPAVMAEGIQVIDLPPAEKEKFLRIAYDEGWKDVIQKNPQTGPELKKLLSKSK
jgi:TRAP-type C4-dicarboxylate transport system substrate-binding protein